MTVHIGSMALDVPIVNGSGAFDITSVEPGWAADAFLTQYLGAYVTKTVTIQPRIGNPRPRIARWPGGLINAVGIANPGVSAALVEWREVVSNLGIPIILSLYGTPDSLRAMVDIVEESGEWIDAYELNLSCPNVAGTIDVAASVRAVRAATGRPIIAKLAPDERRIVEWSRNAEFEGVHAITAVNTLRSPATDPLGRPLLGSEMGGVSGRALHETALRCVAVIREAVAVPIIGIGGIENDHTAQAMLDAGADIVGVGTWARLEPSLLPALGAWATSSTTSARSLAHAGKSH